jgi:hypothetical protein
MSSAAAPRRSVSARRLPLVRSVDVAVSGGTLGAVAAALAAARAGARVLLAAPRLYLGTDLCGGLRLWRPEEAVAAGPLTEALFAAGEVTTPLRVKQTLQGALLQAGVEVLLGCFPAGVLEGADGRAAGLLLADRAGRQGVAAGALIDGTPHALLAQAAGAAGYAPGPHRLSVERVVLGGDESPDAAPRRSIPSGLRVDDAEPAYHLYGFELELPGADPAAFAALEQTVRDRTARPGRLRSAEFLHYVPPIAVRDSAEIHILAAADPGTGPAGAEATGRELGRAAAGAATARPPAEPVRVRPAAPGAETEPGADLREELRGLRAVPEGAAGVPAEGDSLPLLATAEVVVVGGGTAGAAAAIAAAREGARVLVCEYQEALGGTGTLGLITQPYHGRDVGFAREVCFPAEEETVSVEDKMEWLRREARAGGGEVWFGTLAWGAWCRGERLAGVAVATPWGHGLIEAGAVLDATGNAQVAAAAGVPCRFGAGDEDIALQGTGLPVRAPGVDMTNTDYLLVDETDVVDVSRAMLGVTQRLDAAEVYDLAPFIQSRERQTVVGEHTLSHLDQVWGRTFHDTIVLSRSDYDSHGYPSLPYFALLPHTEETRAANHPAPAAEEARTPYRALLPRGREGLLVLGLGISMHRDASALVRMQRDLLNQGYAAGLAAVTALREARGLRGLDVRALQRRLAAMGALPESILAETDNYPPDEETVAAAVGALASPATTYDEAGKALAVVFTVPEAARPRLRQAYPQADGAPRLGLARLLGFLGCDDGAAELIDWLERTAFDAKIFQGNMAEYAHLPTPVDATILALGYSGAAGALPPILDKLQTLEAGTTLSHHRAVALALEALADPGAAAPLAELLGRPGMRGHALHRIEPLYDKPRERRRREGALREIVLARALCRCGDHEGLGRAILEEYARDLRGLFARHAHAVLARL